MNGYNRGIIPWLSKEKPPKLELGAKRTRDRSMLLTKTNFVQYLRCPKSLWLAKHDPDNYSPGDVSLFLQKLISDGYAVESYAREFLENNKEVIRVDFQAKFSTPSSLYARADAIEVGMDGSIHLYEVKSTTSVKTKAAHNHLKDACFQVIAAERSGASIDRVSIIHVNGDYVRKGDIVPNELLMVVDVTKDVRAIQSETELEIDAALALLAEEEIDRTSCSCLQKSRAHHCDTFSYFNQGVPDYSIYGLPRLSQKKRSALVDDNIFDLNDIPDDFVLSPQQQAVVCATKSQTPIINQDAIGAFLNELSFPLHFFDFETYASAIPLADGMQPHKHTPIQYLLHILADDGELSHKEYLSDA